MEDTWPLLCARYQIGTKRAENQTFESFLGAVRRERFNVGVPQRLPLPSGPGGGPLRVVQPAIVADRRAPPTHAGNTEPETAA